ncbi:hypothetical protein K439DRAFT_1625139 [Ramaria rubella]|nr:hypothetical protein K439DRAFT_1625139 [Ramaria rubella]
MPWGYGVPVRPALGMAVLAGVCVLAHWRPVGSGGTHAFAQCYGTCEIGGLVHMGPACDAAHAVAPHVGVRGHRAWCRSEGGGIDVARRLARGEVQVHGGGLRLLVLPGAWGRVGVQG